MVSQYHKNMQLAKTWVLVDIYKSNFLRLLLFFAMLTSIFNPLNPAFLIPNVNLKRKFRLGADTVAPGES